MASTISIIGLGNIVGDNNKVHNNIQANQFDNEQKLKQNLLKVGVELQDIKELLGILTLVENQTIEIKDNIYIETWTTKIMDKMKKGIGNISTKVTSKILSEYIMNYFQN